MTLEVIYKGRLAHRYSGLTKRQAEAAAARYSQYFGKILGGEMTVRVISSARENAGTPPPRPRRGPPPAGGEIQSLRAAHPQGKPKEQ